MAAGTGGSPSVTRLSFGVTNSDWANAGRGRMRAAVRSRHESLGMCAPTGDVGGQSYGAPSPIYRPPHSFPRTPDDGEGGGVTDYRYPDSHVFYRKLGRSYPRIVRGEGCWLYDEQGKGYLDAQDRKSTRLNSSHGYISYAVFCLKKKKQAPVRRSSPPPR